MKLSAKVVLAALLVFAATAARAADPPAYVLIDADKGTVLADHEADTLWYPASLSKLMTAYVTFSYLKAGTLQMSSLVTVSQHALDQDPAKMGFPVGTVMTVDNALKMLLVKSANDIAVAIAESVGGKESAFVATMNQTAARLGMVSTHYTNPHGLPDTGQVTTARDMAVLARAIWADFPEYRPYLGIPAIKSGKVVLASENQLLERYTGTNGMKTGFTCSAGYNLVASATRDGRTIIAVVLGEQSWDDVSERAASLLNRGFGPPLLSGAGRQTFLSSFETTPAKGPAVDMHAYGVCKAGPDPTGDATEGSQPSLQPRFVLMDPVVVTTGTPPKAPTVPLPRLRPAIPTGAGATG